MLGTRIANVVNRDIDGSFNSDPVSILNAQGYSIQIVWAGADTPIGTFFIQESNNGTSWENVTGASVAAGGGPGSAFFNMPDSYAALARVQYDWTSDGLGDAAVADAVVKQ